jgi:predicted RNA-binding Zn ribbon-like protein
MVTTMEPAGTLPPLAPTLPFKFVGGRVALDLLNTADWLATGPALDRLASYERLLEWAEGVGVVSPAVSSHLRKRAASRPAEAERALERSRELRRALHRAVVAVVSGRGVASALERLSPFLHEALGHLVLETDRAGSAIHAGWQGLDETLDGPLWPVVWDATQLFLSPEAERLRVCGGQDCGWAYVDHSRNGLRRWCEMETCGTRAKNRRRGRRARPVRSPSV